MISNIYLLCIIVGFFETISALPYYRYRRQINSPETDAFPYESQSRQFNSVSGSIPGNAYYGIGSDPNYGSFISKPNTANGNGIIPISYNPDSSLYGYLIQPNNKHQQAQQNDWYNNNNNNAWQNPNMNNYYNQFYNRYPPGSQGWYATGGNYWYNNGQSIIVHRYLLMISIAILIFCK